MGLRTTIALITLFVHGLVTAQNDEHPLPYVHQEPAYDVAPRFPDGTEAMMWFLRDSIRYPEPERSQRKQGNVLVQFTVDRKGVIKDIRVVNGVAGAPNLAREAERVIASMPPWLPARKEGKRVAAEVRMSVPFELNKGHR